VIPLVTGKRGLLALPLHDDRAASVERFLFSSGLRFRLNNSSLRPPPSCGDAGADLFPWQKGEIGFFWC